MRDSEKDQKIFAAFKYTLIHYFNFQENLIQTPVDLVTVYEQNKKILSKQKGVMEYTSSVLSQSFNLPMSAKQLSHYYAKTFSKHGKLIAVSQSGKVEALKNIIKSGHPNKRKCELVQECMNELDNLYAKSAVEGFVYREWKLIEESQNQANFANLFQKENRLFKDQFYVSQENITPQNSVILEKSPQSLALDLLADLAKSFQ